MVENGDGVLTIPSGVAIGSVTLANDPVSATAIADVNNTNQSTIGWATGDATDYLVQNITAGTDSGWLTGVTSYTFTNLGCGTNYSYRVKGRNADLTDTGWSSTVSATTHDCGGVMIVSSGGGGGGSNNIIPSVLPPTTSYDSTPGQLIKAVGNSSVYYLSSNGKRYTFPQDKVFFSWYPDFSSVKTVSESELASHQIGGNMHYRSGSSLVKVTTDPRVYAVQPNGILRWIPNEATALKLYGSTWNKNINDLPDAFFAPPNYNIGEALAATGNQFPDGYIAKLGSDTYYISGTTKRLITSAGSTANNIQAKFVHTATADQLAGYTNGTSITGYEGGL